MLYFKPFNYHYEFLQISKPLVQSITLKEGETIKAEVIDILPTGGVVIKAKGIYITVQTEIPLKKDTQLLLKVLDTGELTGKVKLQVVSFSEKGLTFPENIQSLKQEIANTLKNPQLSEAFINNVLTISPQIKNKHIKYTLVEALKDFLNSKKEPFETLKNSGFYLNIKDISPDRFSYILKEKSILLELLLASPNNPEKIKDRKKLKEIKTSLEGYQIISNLTGGIASFLPVFFNDLKKGDIFFLKKEEKSKKHFFCRVDLSFEKEGDITADIFLFEKDLMVSIYVENEEFKNKISSKIKELEEKLKSSGFRYVFFSFKKRKESLSSIAFDEKFSVSA